MATVPKSTYPAETKGKSDADEGERTNRRAFWEEEITKANRRWEIFQQDGDAVHNRYMLQSKSPGDKYNILYSSTETIKPSLYGQTPKVEVKNRQQDTEDTLKVAAAMILEAVGQYAVDTLDFDYVLQNTVSDFTLPGLGEVWVRYDPKFAPMYAENDNKTPLLNEDGSPKEYLTFEGLALDYVSFKDWKCGQARFWTEVPWVSRRVYFTKKQARERFGKAKADKLVYSESTKGKDSQGKAETPKRQAIIEEIWDREEMEVVWYSDNYKDDVLDVKADPLKLEGFFPCPRPLRAVWNTQDIIPKALYSQYKAQAAELDRLTERIRYLTEALKVRGLYDGSQANLALVLDGPGNKMIPVQDWANFMGNGGITGVVQWVPIKEVVQVLSELYKQREIAKNEIYEITGFGDIMRGTSKASETLGAQQIKQDWATGRLKDMQREVQRFIRDIIRMFIEVAATHFSDKTLTLYSGFTPAPPTQEEMMAQQAAAAQGQQPPLTEGQKTEMMFKAALKLIRSEKLRCAAIGIETDSTVLPDEAKERADRMQFLSSMGAFLQQAGPMAMQFPDMRGLLGGIMMFTLRTFSSSRALEKEFETFQKKLEAMPPTPPPGEEKGDGGEAQAAATQQAAQLKSDTDKAIASGNDQTKRYEIDKKAEAERNKLQQDHDYRMAQLEVERDRLRFEKQKLALGVVDEERQIDFDREDKEREAAQTASDAAQAAEEAELNDERERLKIKKVGVNPDSGGSDGG